MSDLKSLFSGKKATSDKEKTSQYCGMKLDLATFGELCGIVDLPATAGGADAFKVLVAIAVGAKKQGVTQELIKAASAE